MARTVWTVMVAAVAIAVATGCSPQSDPAPTGDGKAAPLSPLPGGEPALDASVVATADPNRVDQPLGAYVVNNNTLKMFRRASALVRDKCMKDFGFQPEFGWQEEAAAEQTDWTTRYGLWKAEDAAAHGYWSTTASTGKQSFGMPYITEAATGVWQGTVQTYLGKAVPPGGCNGEAIRAVFGTSTPPQDDMVGPTLFKESLTRARQDSRVVKLSEQWRTCMKTAGFDYPDPMAPFDAWSTKRGNDKRNAVISAEEKKAASADVACKASTKLFGTTLAADVAYQKVLVDRNVTALRASITLYDPYVDRASKIIAAG
ncbi:hypothetical protein [Longispora urticae]